MNRKKWKRFISTVLLLALWLSFFAVVNGCGKKGPPLPPEGAVDLLEINELGSGNYESLIFNS